MHSHRACATFSCLESGSTMARKEHFHVAIATVCKALVCLLHAQWPLSVLVGVLLDIGVTVFHDKSQFFLWFHCTMFFAPNNLFFSSSFLFLDLPLKTLDRLHHVCESELGWPWTCLLQPGRPCVARSCALKFLRRHRPLRMLQLNNLGTLSKQLQCAS